MSSRSSDPLVLLVEDNAAIRGAFAILLAESGFRVLQAATGAEALERASDKRPDVVLMDLGLPDVNGLVVTRKLKADPRTRHAGVIALTGRALETDRRACLAAGCAAYLAKPVNTQELLRTIDEVMLEGRERTMVAE